MIFSSVCTAGDEIVVLITRVAEGDETVLVTTDVGELTTVLVTTVLDGEFSKTNVLGDEVTIRSTTSPLSWMYSLYPPTE